MPESPIIIDTGPLVAFLVENEPRHDWAVQQFKTLPSPFLTCEPVLTEAFHLLGRTQDGHEQFFRLLRRGLLVVNFQMTSQVELLQSKILKYSDLPMSLADACLVRMAEQNAAGRVFTLDNHFKIYRKNGRQPIALLVPE